MDANELGSIFRGAAACRLAAIADAPGVRDWAEGRIRLAMDQPGVTERLATGTEAWLAADRFFDGVVIKAYDPDIHGQNVAMILPAFQRVEDWGVWPFGSRPFMGSIDELSV
jgi:hypothetical protein